MTRVADLSLDGLTAKLTRILTQRRALYELQQRKNNMSEADAAAALDELVEIARLWRLWASHAPELRTRWPDITAARRARLNSEADGLLDQARRAHAATPSPAPVAQAAPVDPITAHPAVGAVLAAFPDARITSSAPLVRTDAPHPTTDAEDPAS